MARLSLSAIAWVALAACVPQVREEAGTARLAPGAGSRHLPSAPVEVPLTPYFRQLKTVQLISGRDSLTLLLDTGGGQTLLTVEAAERLGCSPFGRQVGFRMSGERVDFAQCAGVPLDLGGLRLAEPVVGVFDLMALLPPSLPKLDGVLSMKSFEDRVVSLDLSRGRMVLESAASAAERRRTMLPLTARLATGEDGGLLTVFLAARGRDAPVWLLLDSGNLVGTLLSPPAARQVGVPLGAGDGADSTYTFPLEVLGLPAASQPVHVRDLILDGALGADFMEQGIFMFDLRERLPWVGVQR